ncbi:nucleolus and neural progenitor protein isoform X2 [Heliangelus exortis]|uniref:nucleolus and neural progenitor protein isoform X2 n=1 Tax=Heliangelus exortis TaxID=472823 RepID=UPI003A8E265A
MAAPEAAWNRLDVPWPASSATVALAEGHPAVGCLPALRRQCGVAGKRLSGTGLAAEGRVLRAVLYVYHSRLLRHRPYLALKQVEQCTKRLWKMNLVGCIETLAGLIPTKKTSQAHGEYLVPSQPVLEAVALKVLGGCKLILRLLDCCCKAFLLSVKHLCSEEFILLNTVASGLLSRLCSFLGVDVSTEMKKQKARMLTTKKCTGWLKNFPTLPEAVSEMGKKRNVAACRNAVRNCNIPCAVDIGEPVLVTRASRGKCLGFDVKSLLRPSRPLTQQGIGMTSTPLKAKSASLSSRIASMQDAGSLVQMVQTATSFGELSEALRKVIVWCKGNKFKSAAYFLRNKLLKSNRLHHVEAQGCSLKKKLCCVKTSVRKYLLYGSQNTRWLKRYRGARFCPRRIRSSSRVKRKTLKTVQQKPSELYEVCENSTSLVLSPYQDGPPSWGGGSNAVTASVELSTVRTPKQLLLEGSPVPVLKEATENMDIDSIFAAMGV